MKLLSTKLKEILFGSVGACEGGTPLRAELSYPLLDGTRKYIYWEGNSGLIVTMWKKIEKLEKELEELKSKKK